jgi:hypothetical protein
MKTTPPALVRHLRASFGRLILTVIACAAGPFFSGCASSYEVKVDSIAKPKAEDAISYKINNRNVQAAEDSLRHKEAVGFVRTALSGKGMYETTDVARADVVVDLDYGVGPPQVRRDDFGADLRHGAGPDPH